jgi:hypothetical protein
MVGERDLQALEKIAKELPSDGSGHKFKLYLGPLTVLRVAAEAYVWRCHGACS